MLTNYKNISEQNGIRFIDDINVIADNIPVEDYDLSIILGNLLDNAINACIESGNFEKYISIQIYMDDNDKFVIHTKNSISTSNKSQAQHINDLEHGYGIRNIELVIEQYHGMQKIIPTPCYETWIVIPILDARKRKQPS